MRYYDLIVTRPGETKPYRRWTSHPNGTTGPFDPGALEIEFDMPILPYGTPSGGQTLSVHGVSLEDLTQAQQFAGLNVELKAGFQKGLPLANPAQSGTILTAQIFQSFGNWEGTDMTLDFVLFPSVYTSDTPGNIVLNWKSGTTLASAIQQTLSVAYPDMQQSVTLSGNLVAPADLPGIYGTLEEFAYFISEYTQANFQNRVQISIQAGKIIVFDDTYKPGPVQINFNDFVGQPTWIEPNIIQLKTAMRADLQLGSIIKMPTGLQNAPGLVTTTGASLPSSLKYQSTFQNSFTVIELRQIGSFRSPASADWATILNCVVNPDQDTTGNPTVTPFQTVTNG